ncbi:ATPase [Adhaeribacter aerolatus]|uniref:ATPase n=1 Tax=Adhaeribacter aerolatus TaxID=670289 RepID=A0A512B2W0_9BACT|nr:SRPBCC domain-containing protein [Adhaeribacter aerolatus]GEO06289.1 ATPase [Adhaeribacter aerolatus]
MNAATQVIKKNIGINAPKEKVWEILTRDAYTRQWYAAFSEGAHAETDWQLGSKAVFKDNSGEGIVAKVIRHEPQEVLAVEYEGLLSGGKEVYDTPEAQAVKGGRESYYLTGQGGHTQLHVEADMGEEYLEMMAGAWDTALLKIKDLAEQNG